MTDTNHLIPLTPAVFHILFALAEGEKHGYEIMKDVQQVSQGKVKMGNGTLYGSIKRMLADNLIENAGDKVNEDDTRRKYYRLTNLGRKVLNLEIERYVQIVRVLQSRDLVVNSLSVSLSK